jgi:hypothetical protein
MNVESFTYMGLMREEHHTRKSAHGNGPDNLVDSRDFLSSATLSLIGIAFSLLLAMYASFSFAARPFISSIQSLTYFAGGIFLFAFIIIGVAGLMRRKYRDAFLLKQRLAGIYLSALRKSALNPQRKSSISND